MSPARAVSRSSYVMQARVGWTERARCATRGDAEQVVAKMTTVVDQDGARPVMAAEESSYE
jgi:hypothetical protein